MGFTKVEDVEKADVILINTCAIRDNAMEKVLGEIGNFTCETEAKVLYL